MTTRRTLRVLVVDEHDVFRAGLHAVLEEQGFEVLVAAGGDAALECLRSFSPDAVLIDMNMAGMSGVEATQRVLDARPETAVVVTTVDGDEHRVLDAVAAGASGYVLKDSHVEDIVRGVRAAAGGEAMIAPRPAGGVLTSLPDAEAETDHEATTVPASMTERERDVLQLLASGRENVEIADRLHVPPRRVKQHIASVLKKLGVENRNQAAVGALRYDMVDKPPAPVA